MTAIRDLLVAFTDQDRASRRQGWVVCAVVLGLLFLPAIEWPEPVTTVVTIVAVGSLGGIVPALLLLLVAAGMGDPS